MRRTLTALAGIVLSLALAACAAPDAVDAGALPPGPDDDPPGAARTLRPDAPDPAGLVGLWRVTAEGESDDTWLTLDSGSYILWRGGCASHGGWSGASGAFVADAPHAWSGGAGCDPERPVVPWLAIARSYEQVADGWVLLGADGAVLASLRVDGRPTPGPDIWDGMAEPPAVVPETRDRFTDPAPLPDYLVAPAVDDVVGRWVPTTSVPTDPHVELSADGRWTGSDGCNGMGGAWALGADGRLLTTSGLSALVACDGQGLAPERFAGAARLGLDRDVLVLLDRAGAETGRLVRG